MTAGLARPVPWVAVHSTGPITEITLGNGARRNALPSQAWDELAKLVRESDQDESTRVILVRGRDGMFCAGSDMTEWIDAELDAVEDSFGRMEAAFRAVEECSLPVVAEVHGTAAGAGCQLALACDLRYLADSAVIGMPIARLGINPSPSFAARMVALCGPALTREMLYTGALLDAPTAVAHGLANTCLPEAELREFTTRTVAQIATQPRATLRAAKRSVSVASEALRQATRHNDQAMISPADFQDGIAQFLGRS